ncbi:MAG TPA: DUF1345 domain-containing protein [Kineosporiaceae bacterium]
MSTRQLGQRDAPAPLAVADATAGTRVAFCLVPGIVVAVLLARAGLVAVAPLGGWDVFAAFFLGWVWVMIGRADPDRTAALAVRQDPSQSITDVLLLLAAVASLLGVGDVILLGAAKGDAIGPTVAITLAILSVIVSWLVVHTVFTLRYARLYYLGPDGGIDFKQEGRPQYLDFAYVAFTVGMTFQVSDTDLNSSSIRSTVLWHALLSYLFGAVIIATTINLVAGLAK